jgi:YfiH family protein
MTALVRLDQVRPLSDLDGVAHGFTSRQGGVSTGRLATLNLALRGDETPANLVENWDRVARTLQPHLSHKDVVVLHQVHGGRVLRVESAAGALNIHAEADAAFTVEPDVVLAVRTADCVPVLLATDGGVAVAHAGWRGVAADVVPATVSALVTAVGCSSAAVCVGVGPHISRAVYQVGVEVVQAFERAGIPQDVFLQTRDEGLFVDLGAAVCHQLRMAGVEQVQRIERCTALDFDLFSHRRDGELAGRQAGVVVRC